MPLLPISTPDARCVVSHDASRTLLVSMAGNTLLSLWGMKLPPPPHPPQTPPASDPAEDPTIHRTKDESMIDGLSGSRLARDRIMLQPALSGSESTNSPESSQQTDSHFESQPTQCLSEPSLLPNDSAPKYLVTLRAPPERLHEIKPRVHAFFTKRPKPKTPAASMHTESKSKPLGRAPWPSQHVRPERLEEVQLPIGRRVRINRSDHRKLSWELQSRPEEHDSSTSSYRVFTTPEKKKRRVIFGPDLLQKLANNFSTETGLDRLRQKIMEPSALDAGRFETQMWTEKWAPQTATEHFMPESASRISLWIAEKLKELTDMPPQQRSERRKGRPRKYDLDDFIVDGHEAEVTRMADLAVLVGPPGSGKLAAVYAAARDNGAYVYEINASQRRQGRDLESIMSGIGSNHAVHRHKKAVVLIEDADIVFENEYGSFWTEIERLTRVCRRPVVATCADPRRFGMTWDRMELIPLVIDERAIFRARAIVWLVAAVEGFVLPETEILALARKVRGDIRRLLTELQFWCQLVAARPSGVDCYARQAEVECGRRVLIETTLPSEARAPSVSRSIDEAALMSDLTSQSDRPRLEIICRSGPRETVDGYQLLSEWRDDPEVHLDGPYRTFLRGMFEYAPDSQLASDIAPYTRTMARADQFRAAAVATYAATGARVTRRACVSAGIDDRQHLNGIHLSILRTWSLPTRAAAALSTPAPQYPYSTTKETDPMIQNAPSKRAVKVIDDTDDEDADATDVE